jgi:hypothetical protein
MCQTSVHWVMSILLNVKRVNVNDDYKVVLHNCRKYNFILILLLLTYNNND